MSEHVRMGWAVVLSGSSYIQAWCLEEEDAKTLCAALNTKKWANSTEWVVVPGALHGEIVWNGARWPST